MSTRRKRPSGDPRKRAAADRLEPEPRPLERLSAKLGAIADAANTAADDLERLPELLRPYITGAEDEQLRDVMARMLAADPAAHDEASALIQLVAAEGGIDPTVPHPTFGGFR